MPSRFVNTNIPYMPFLRDAQKELKNHDRFFCRGSDQFRQFSLNRCSKSARERRSVKSFLFMVAEGKEDAGLRTRDFEDLRGT